MQIKGRYLNVSLDLLLLYIFRRAPLWEETVTAP